MEKFQLVQTYFNAQNLQGSFWDFYADMFLTAVLSFILSRIYIKYGNSISNRKNFSGNFIILSLTTMLIISIIKSSLALSLGLVGALSIVRFRSAIKEPEELAYLFLTISIGLGFGANQRYITILAFAFISIALIIKGITMKSSKEQNLYLNISSKSSEKVDLKKIIEKIKESSSLIRLRRVDKDSDGINVTLYVKFDNLNKLDKAEKSLRELDNDLEISFIEDRGIFS